jgi:hypothetical protein
MARHRILLGAALVTLVAARPLSAQRIQDWQYRWYWGAKGGMVSYLLPTAGTVTAPQFGGEWLITGRRVALYIAYSTTQKVESDTFSISGLSGTNNGVTFEALRRIQVDLLTLIGDRPLQPYIGGGFVIETLSGARSTAATTSSTVTNAIQAAGSGGFLQVMLGAQLRLGRKAAIFGHYQYSPQGRAFLLQGGSNSFEAGLRYAFLSAKENDPTRR